MLLKSIRFKKKKQASLTFFTLVFVLIQLLLLLSMGIFGAQTDLQVLKSYLQREYACIVHCGRFCHFLSNNSTYRHCQKLIKWKICTSNVHYSSNFEIYVFKVGLKTVVVSFLTGCNATRVKASFLVYDRENQDSDKSKMSRLDLLRLTIFHSNCKI